METCEPVANVIVNLIVQGHNCIEIPHRSIRLDRTNNSVSLGRASKDHAKGFIATEENGWLDSPVMSREHAEIVADFNNQVVNLRDLGSLHGTYINDEDERLPVKEPREVHDGDRIRFGVPILRNGEAFTPAKVKVGIAFNRSRVQSAGCSTFAVPEGSDVEEGYSSDDGKENPKPEAMVRSLDGLVDLARYAPGNVADLTGHYASPPIRISDRADDRIDDKTTGRILVLTSSEARSPASVAEDRSERNMYGSSIPRRDARSPPYSISEDEDEGDSDISDISDISDVSDISDGEMSRLSDTDSHLYLVQDPFDTDLEDLEDDLDFEPMYSSEDGLIDEDDPDAAIWDDAPAEETTAREAEQVSVHDQPTTEVLADDKAGDSSPMELEPHNSEPTYVTASSRVSVPSILNPLENPVENPGSSSGLAVPKPLQIETSTTDKSSADVLGPETGAVEASENGSGPKGNNNVTESSSAHHQPVAMFPLLKAGDDFLNSAKSVPDNVWQPLPTAPEAADGIDGISAFEFQQKKKALQAVLEGEPSQSRRTHVGIADIVDNCPAQPDEPAATDRKGKRKAADISKVSKAERRWATALYPTWSTGVPHQSVADVMSGTSPGFQPAFPSWPQGTIIQTRSRPDPARPAKRMRLRQVAEKIGYAALGGATVAATIMTTLIYTAPSFT
ncbi:hypothetical protein QBC33DRAFT_229729 [Phialemonium atrogriseum]|uniref:FHA domain-containing protein n=1 Tax=Phialemonium atrogriseum TaxID=1093897 RepID=A0AAJ0FKH2_9PEZI|nr:uncharacterized protein QBC33DRAFT_229729 [Phialemonium atrogriseum]KAK1771072.1 hypothetical protein QBC33DRAFT_229729 [Phialemonium atrogriseum]